MSHLLTIRSEQVTMTGTYNNPRGGLETVTDVPVTEYRVMCSCGWQDKTRRHATAELMADRHAKYPHRR